MPLRNANGKVRLVVFDWAGTTVDHGCFAPVAPFVKSFAAEGIEISLEEARAPMGLEKRDHLRAIVRLPRVASAWRERHGRPCSEADIERIFERRFIPAQLEVIDDCCTLIDGVLATVEALRSAGIKIGTTTGYFREAAQRCYRRAEEQGYRPDLNLCPNDVKAGRPAPWMIFRIMETLDVYPTRAVVKVGDTVPDVEEGRNAGVWTVGVAVTGSEVGLSAAEWSALDRDEQNARAEDARQTLLEAGAHYVINSVADLPSVLPAIEARIEAGETP